MKSSAIKLRAIKVGDTPVLVPLRMDIESLRRLMRKVMRRHGVSATDLLRGL